MDALESVFSVPSFSWDGAGDKTGDLPLVPRLENRQTD